MVLNRIKCSAIKPLVPGTPMLAIPNKKKKEATVIVNDKDLTAAIGVKGQNAKLASQATMWKIDIMSVSQAKEQGIRYRRIEQ